MSRQNSSHKKEEVFKAQNFKTKINDLHICFTINDRKYTHDSCLVSNNVLGFLYLLRLKFSSNYNSVIAT